MSSSDCRMPVYRIDRISSSFRISCQGTSADISSRRTPSR